MGSPCIIHVKIVNFNLPDEYIKKFKKLFKPISTSMEINYPHGWSDSEKKDFKLGTQINKSTGGGPLSKRKICPEPFSRLTITHNGDALPCCVDWSHKLKVGNIKNSNLDKIWNGEEANKIRLYHLRNEIPKDSPCYSCSYMQGHPEYETIDGVESKLIEDYSK